MDVNRVIGWRSSGLEDIGASLIFETVEMEPCARRHHDLGHEMENPCTTFWTNKLEEYPHCRLLISVDILFYYTPVPSLEMPKFAILLE